MTKRPNDTRFKQQQLHAWQPIMAPRWIIGTFLVTGVVFIILAIIFLAESASILEYAVQYDTKCNGGACSVTLDVQADMKAPVYLYYRLTNYFQNHRRYVKSRSDSQLRGETNFDYNAIADCAPLQSSSNSDNPPKSTWYFPCGLIAYSYFNDTIDFKKQGSGSYALNKNEIAWPSDVDKKFKNPKNWGQPSFEFEPMPGVTSLVDPDFIVWMRTAALPDFRKLYGVIKEDIPKGKYTVDIVDNYPTSYQGTKSVVISTSSWLGGKNDFLGIIYLIVGFLSVFVGLFFFWQHKTSPQPLADIELLDWSR